MAESAKTLEDLARISGLSIATISRALRDHPAVNAATKQKIVRLAIEHDYPFQRYSPAGLMGAEATVTVVIPQPLARQPRLSDPFLMELVAAIGEAARERNCDMMVSHFTPVGRNDLIELMHLNRTDGVIFLGQSSLHTDFNALAEGKGRFVVWGAELPDQRYCSIGSDNHAGTLRATRHLLRLGRKRIAFLGATLTPEIQQRHEGYVAALQEADIPFDPVLAVESHFDLESAESAVETLLSAGTRFDAIVAASDILAFGAIRSLTRKGLRVPEDVSVIGYDNVAFGRCIQPALSTISQDVDKAGRLLVSKLINPNRSASPISERLPTDLIIRKSCGG